MSKVRYVKDEEWGTTFPNFQKNEFTDKHGIGEGISYSLLQVLQEIRNNFGSVEVTSGYRCPECNASVGGDPNSWHLQGFAADFYLGDGRLQNQEIRMGIRDWIKKLPNVHYCYCNVNGNFPNMGSCIHVDTYPIYEEEVKVTVPEPIAENTEVNQVKIICGYDTLRVRTSPDLGDNFIGFAIPGFYNILSTYEDGTYNWYEVEENKWFASVDGCTEYHPILEEKEEEPSITPTDSETSENEPKNEEIEHVIEPINQDKENPIIEFIKWVLKLISKLIKKEGK